MAQVREAARALSIDAERARSRRRTARLRSQSAGLRSQSAGLRSESASLRSRSACSRSRTAHSRRSTARRGALRTSVLLAIVCATCLAGAIALAIGLSSDRAAITTDLASNEARAAPSEPRVIGSTDPRSTEVPPDAVAPRTPIATPEPPPDFEGRGVLRGRLTAQPGLAVPERWKLLVSPNTFLRGSERAESRTIEFAHGETLFRVDDLPLGGYAVRAQAGGLNCLPVSVLLVRGAENQFVSLVLAPSGYVQGSVLDADDRPAEGVPVTLEASSTRARRTLETDVAGGYRFDDVTDGEYTLYFGRPEASLVPPVSLAFTAPALTVTERKLPATGIAEVWARDENGTPLSDAVISGFSAHAGVIDARTGRDGSVIVRHLPAGRYRLHARLEDGRSGTAVANIDAGKTATIDIRLER